MKSAIVTRRAGAGAEEAQSALTGPSERRLSGGGLRGDGGGHVRHLELETKGNRGDWRGCPQSYPPFLAHLSRSQFKKSTGRRLVPTWYVLLAYYLSTGVKGRRFGGNIGVKGRRFALFNRGEGSCKNISGSTKSTTTTTVTGLTNGTQYTFLVRAVNYWGYGAASTVAATPLWPAPANLVGTPDDGRIYLEWDRNPGITDYRVETKVTSNDAFVKSSPFSAGFGSKTIAAIHSLTNDTGYTFTVLAAQGSADTSWPATVNATPIVDSPDAPTNLSATPSNGQVTLSWDDPGNSTITKYQVSIDGGTNFTDISGSTRSTTTTTATDLTTAPSTRLRCVPRTIPVPARQPPRPPRQSTTPPRLPTRRCPRTRTRRTPLMRRTSAS